MITRDIKATLLEFAVNNPDIPRIIVSHNIFRAITTEEEYQKLHKSFAKHLCCIWVYCICADKYFFAKQHGEATDVQNRVWWYSHPAKFAMKIHHADLKWIRNR